MHQKTKVQVRKTGKTDNTWAKPIGILSTTYIYSSLYILYLTNGFTVYTYISNLKGGWFKKIYINIPEIIYFCFQFEW